MAADQPDEEQLIESMQVLSDGLERIARRYEQNVELREEDPETFGAGHFVLYSRRQDKAMFTIEEQYTGTDWSDPYRVPTSWTWNAWRIVHRNGASWWIHDGQGEVASADVVQLLVRARDWVRMTRDTAPNQDAPNRMAHHSHRPRSPSL